LKNDTPDNVPKPAETNLSRSNSKRDLQKNLPDITRSRSNSITQIKTDANNNGIKIMSRKGSQSSLLAHEKPPIEPIPTSDGAEKASISSAVVPENQDLNTDQIKSGLLTHEILKPILPESKPITESKTQPQQHQHSTLQKQESINHEVKSTVSTSSSGPTSTSSGTSSSGSNTNTNTEKSNITSTSITTESQKVTSPTPKEPHSNPPSNVKAETITLTHNDTKPLIKNDTKTTIQNDTKPILENNTKPVIIDDPSSNDKVTNAENSLQSPYDDNFEDAVDDDDQHASSLDSLPESDGFSIQSGSTMPEEE
jgi:hypothetical protein